MLIAAISEDKLVKIGLIGYGSIGQVVAEELVSRPLPNYELSSILLRPAQFVAARSALPGIHCTASFDDFVGQNLDIVIEVAGQGAVRDYGILIADLGLELVLISSGALADDSFRSKLEAAAQKTGARVVLPSGALAGFDGLMSLRRAGLLSVKYTSRKPPEAWMGTPAQQNFDLASLSEPTVIFEGSAKEAALKFPKNANLAATVGIAGLGLEKTEVALIADPTIRENVGQLSATSQDATLEVTVSGQSSPQNPKTSLSTAMSVLSCLENRSAAISLL